MTKIKSNSKCKKEITPIEIETKGEIKGEEIGEGKIGEGIKTEIQEDLEGIILIIQEMGALGILIEETEETIEQRNYKIRMVTIPV